MAGPFLDSTFDFDGIVTTDFFGDYDRGYSVTVQSDGKILVAGETKNGANYYFGLVRYNIDGSLDSTFDTDGKVVNTDLFYGYSATVQSDGKILVSGNASGDFGLVRYNTDGSLDTTFNGGGIVNTNFLGGDDQGYSIVVQNDGKILIAGTAYNNGGSNRDFALARYNTDGSLDTTFDGDGKVNTNFFSDDDNGYSVTVQSDGKILVAGNTVGSGANQDFGLVRYNTDGSLDTTFNGDGIVNTDFLGGSDNGYSVTIQSDGKILVAGNADSDFGLVRYNINGSLDTTFDGDGIVTTDFFGFTDSGRSITVQNDGKILVAGLITNSINFDFDFGLARYNADGSLDTTFGTSGKYNLDVVPGNHDTAYSISIQSDSKIVLAGFTGIGIYNYDFAVIRLDNPVTPIANNDQAYTTFQTPINFNILANDSDPNSDIDPNSVDLDPNTAGIQNTFSITEGIFSVDASGIVTFTPDIDFSLVSKISIQYTVSDTTGLTSNISNITINYQSFIQDTYNTLPGVIYGATGWADYNSDGKPDFLLTGDIGIGRISQLYLNTNNEFILDTSTILPAVDASAVGWADYNSDGKPDFLLTGYTGTGQISQLYLNTGSGFILDTSTTLPNVSDGAVGWADYNSDGKPDFLLTGYTGTGQISQLYLNTGAGFILDTSTILPGVDASAVGWTDYNSDGKPDFLLTGWMGTGYISELYLNTGAGFILDTSTNLPRVGSGATVGWADYNGDSKPDLLLTGWTGSSYFSQLYLNTGSGLIADTSVSLPAIAGGISGWSDYNQDGKPDFLLTGYNGGGPLTKLYLNTGAGFILDTSTPLPQVDSGLVAWEDYTGDNLPDFLLTGDTGSGGISQLYVNTTYNSAPLARNDSTFTAWGIPVTLNIVANDWDARNNMMVDRVDLQPSIADIQNTLSLPEGLLTVDNNGVVVFTPSINFSSSTSLTIPYTVSDYGNLISNPANIIITAINTPPSATDDSTNITSNTVLTLNISANDSDPDGSITAFDLDVLTADVQNTITTSAGTFSVDNSGVLIFNPVSNYQGTASLDYQVFDNSGATATANISVLVTNQLPIAVSDSTTTISNTAVTFNISANDSDPDGSITVFDLDISNATIQQNITTGQGIFSVNNNGILSFTPASNFQGTASLDYQVFDNSGATATANISVVVTNQLPIAVDDSINIISNQTITSNIGANDSDPDGSITAFDLDASTPTIETSITTGEGIFVVTFVSSDTGILTFIPASNFQGTASLDYQVFDNSGATATANISVLVNNQLPVANNDSANITSNKVLTLDISANDSDPDGTITGFDLDVLTANVKNTITTSAGTFSVDNNGVLIFNPVSNFQGTAGLDYQVFDNSGATATANISVLVNNQLPIAVSDTTSTISNVAVTFNISTNDSDPDGSITAFDLDVSNSTIQNTISNSQGIFSVNNSGILSFTPASNFQGTASLDYQVFDNSGATATANISVFVTNQLPVANNDSTNITSNTAVTLNISANDSDPDGSITAFDLDASTPTIQQNITTGQGIFNVNSNGELIFTPASNFQGTASLDYQVFDNSGATATANISVLITNQLPIAVSDTTTTISNTAVTLNISANDSDPDGSITAFDLDTSNATIQQNITTGQGIFNVNSNGELIFNPASNFQGTASLDYQVFDNSGATATANISVLVNNQLPIAVSDFTSTISNRAVTFNISANDSDPDGSITAFDLDASNATIQQNITTVQGIFSVNNSGILSFTPASNFQGTANLDYQVFDNSGATATANISVLVNNQLPIAVNDTTTTISNTAVTLNISTNDSDPDGSITAFDLDASNATIQQNITTGQGIFSVNNNGILSFTPASNFQGTASLDYQVFDNSGATATANISIVVGNQSPVANDDTTNTTSNTTVTLNISANDSDPDGSITAFDLDISNTTIQQNITTGQGIFSVNDNGVLVFTPASNFQGIASLPYQVFDNSGATATANISIIVGNQSPVANDDSTNTTSNTAVTLNISTNDSDPDGDITAFDLNISNTSIQQNITNSQGVFSVNNNGVLIFNPASNFQGIASLPYQIFDNSGATATANISILVEDIPTPENILPIANDDSTNTTSNTAVTLNISANDSDPDGDITAFDLNISNTSIQQNITNSQGIFSVNDNGVLVFTPSSDFVGIASLDYQVFDNSGATATANINILVEDIPTPENILPIANDDSTNTTSNTAVTLNISANDSDPDGDITAFDLNISNTSIQQNITNSQGTFSVNDNGVLIFAPASNFQGIASLDYQVFDNSGATATANINILVEDIPTPENILPIANDDSTNTTSNTAVTFNISANDSDIDGDITTFDLNISNTSIQQNITNSQGIFSVNNNGVLVFRPASNFQGIASLPYQVFDNSGATATANISIIVGNQSPVANDDSTNTTSNTAVTLNISANDSDPDGDITTFDLNISNETIQQNITNSQGIFSVNDNGVLVFRPASNFQGTASLDYQVFDNSGATATANISILVEDIPTPENILPIANDDSTSTIINTAVTFNISANDSDPDGDITAFDLNISNTTIQQNITNSQGIFSVNDNGVLVFRPASDFVGIASLDYQVFDNSGATAMANISILVENIPTPENILPIANDDSRSTIINTAVTLNISTNDSDPDGDITAFDLNISNTSIQQNVTNSQGIFSVNNNGVLIFTPSSDFVGIASLDYQIFDNSGATATSNISILVEDIPTPENILPIANDDSTSTIINTAVTLNISANDSDPDGDITAFDIDLNQSGIQVNVNNTEGSFNITSEGDLIFVPASDFVGIVTLPYTVVDNSGATANPANVIITVEDQPTPQPPTPQPPTPQPPTPQPPTPQPPTPQPTPIIEPSDRPNYPVVDKLAILNITDIPGNGNLIGDEQDNLIYGEMPNDTILGFQGNDTLVGYVFNSQNDFGDNILVGGDGNDYLFGSIGNDSLFGESGDDQIVAGAGNDLLQGGTGNDTLSGREGDDLIIDAFTDNDGNNLIYAQAGNDTVQGGNQIDSVSGGKGNDWIQAGDSDDWVFGDFGSDTLFGEGGNDTLSGDNDLGEPTSPEDLIRRDLLMGGEGDDLLLGNQDNDTLLGESGNDHIRGGKDDDLIFGDSEIDNIAGNDLLFGDAGNDTIAGGGGDDTIYGDNADIVGADVNNLRDFLLGDIGNDLIYGNKGDDTLLGVDGNDTLSGGKENDLLFGGDGDDVLIGGFGDDTINTGAGNDLIYIAVDQGVNLITDFQPGGDQLVLIDGLTIDQLQFSAGDGGTLVVYQEQVLAIVRGVVPSQLL
jgi:uncharacterized delta-60 repeat protein